MNQDRIFKTLVITACILVSVCLCAGLLFLGLSSKPTSEPDVDTRSQSTTATETDTATTTEAGTDRYADVVLRETEDKGQAYQDSIAFLGESTTAHLRSRGVLTDGKQSEQVWCGPSNTLALDLSILSKKVSTYSSDEMTVGELAALKKPKYLILCFGLNGIKTFLNGDTGKQIFLTSYQKLIDAVQAASPDTQIILQGAYPIAENADTQAGWTFSFSAAEARDGLVAVREWTRELAMENGLPYLAAEDALVTENGYLIPSYSMDGIHLTAEGYRAVLAYVRTHGV